MDEREAAILAAKQHVERLRRRLRDGQHEIERQQASVRWLRDPAQNGIEHEPTTDR